MSKLSDRLFRLDKNIRYVAVNRSGRITEMTQNPKLPTFNPHESDRFEELLVNPLILRLATYRGKLDMDGTRYVVIRYGPQYQIIFLWKGGHLSIGVELKADVAATAGKIAKRLGLRN